MIFRGDKVDLAFVVGCITKVGPRTISAGVVGEFGKIIFMPVQEPPSILPCLSLIVRNRAVWVVTNIPREVVDATLLLTQSEDIGIGAACSGIVGGFPGPCGNVSRLGGDSPAL